MSRRTRLADALFGEPDEISNVEPVQVKPVSMDALRANITTHRASQRYSREFEGMFEFQATVVDVNPTRVHVDEATAKRIKDITGERRRVWTFYRDYFVADESGAPIDYELYLNDTVAPRVTLRSYDKGRKWAMDVNHVRLLQTGIHFSS